MPRVVSALRSVVVGCLLAVMLAGCGTGGDSAPAPTMTPDPRIVELQTRSAGQEAAIAGQATAVAEGQASAVAAIAVDRTQIASGDAAAAATSAALATEVAAGNAAAAEGIAGNQTAVAAQGTEVAMAAAAEGTSSARSNQAQATIISRQATQAAGTAAAQATVIASQGTEVSELATTVAEQGAANAALQATVVAQGTRLATGPSAGPSNAATVTGNSINFSGSGSIASASQFFDVGRISVTITLQSEEQGHIEKFDNGSWYCFKVELNGPDSTDNERFIIESSRGTEPNSSFSTVFNVPVAGNYVFVLSYVTGPWTMTITPIPDDASQATVEPTATMTPTTVPTSTPTAVAQTSPSSTAGESVTAGFWQITVQRAWVDSAGEGGCGSVDADSGSIVVVELSVVNTDVMERRLYLRMLSVTDEKGRAYTYNYSSTACAMRGRDYFDTFTESDTWADLQSGIRYTVRIAFLVAEGNSSLTMSWAADALGRDDRKDRGIEEQFSLQVPSILPVRPDDV